jgi:CRP/FNR family transcriptional regulator
MEKKQLREQLQKADLFSRLEADDLAALLGIARMRQIDDGEILFAAGDRATGFYVLLQGKIHLPRQPPSPGSPTLSSRNA